MLGIIAGNDVEVIQELAPKFLINYRVNYVYRGDQ